MDPTLAQTRAHILVSRRAGRDPGRRARQCGHKDVGTVAKLVLKAQGHGRCGSHQTSTSMHCHLAPPSSVTALGPAAVTSAAEESVGSLVGSQRASWRGVSDAGRRGQAWQAKGARAGAGCSGLRPGCASCPRATSALVTRSPREDSEAEIGAEEGACDSACTRAGPRESCLRGSQAPQASHQPVPGR